MISDFISNFGSESEMNYSIHVSPEFKFIYFSNPKSACTTLKASLNLSISKAKGLDISYKKLGDIHNRAFNPLLSPEEVGYDFFEKMLADKQVRKISFFRDPVSRFCSAYANKIAHKSDNAKRLLDFLNVEISDAESGYISVQEFARLISEDHRIRDLDEHWRLQTKQICAKLVPDLLIGRLKHAEHDLRFILEKLFGFNFVFFDAPSFDSGNTSNSNEFYAKLDKTAIKQIHEAYAEDYILMDRVESQWNAE